MDILTATAAAIVVCAAGNLAFKLIYSVRRFILKVQRLSSGLKVGRQLVSVLAAELAAILHVLPVTAADLLAVVNQIDRDND